MPYTNYRDAKSRIADLIPFRGNSWHAETIPETGEYCIFSRRTLIGYVNPSAQAFWINSQKYSQSTSRQQNVVRVALAYLGTSPLWNYTQIEGDL
jgi:hypothetical protein